MHWLALRVCPFFLTFVFNLIVVVYSLLEIQAVIATLVESFTFEVAEGVEIDQIRVGTAAPVVKGDWNAGAKLPLKVALRQT